MPPDASATKKRLLDAAYDEFAQYGLAGARMDRIAEVAQANKRSIYMHFGNKEELFNLVIDQALADLIDTVPFTAEDLPGYAGALFDYLLEHPKLLRLAGWANLERPEPRPTEVDAYRSKIEAVAAAQQTGTVARDIAPTDVLALVLALVCAWPVASPALRSLAPEGPWSPERIRRHRAAMTAAARALTPL